MPEVRVFLDLPLEMQRMLSANSISIDDLLRRDGINCPVVFGALPNRGTENVSKTLVPIILASSAGVAVIIYALSRIFESIYSKPHVFEWDELEEVRENGRLLLDSNGTPCMRVVKRHQLIQPQRPQVKHELELQIGIQGVVCRVKIESA